MRLKDFVKGMPVCLVVLMSASGDAQILPQVEVGVDRSSYIAGETAVVTLQTHSGAPSGGPSAESSENRVVLPPEIRRVLQAQRSLPAESRRALQDLRLVAAVELAYFSSQNKYVSPEQLQKTGHLSRGWPHANPDSYKFSCNIDREGLSFVCYADALAPELYHFMVDTSQAVRYARKGRPNAASLMFGTTEESLP